MGRGQSVFARKLRICSFFQTQAPLHFYFASIVAFNGAIVVEHKTQVSPYGIKNNLKHHKSDSCIDPKRFCEVEQQARPSTGAGLAKNGPKSQFQSFPDPNPGLTGSNPVSTPNPDPNPIISPNLDPNSIPDPNPIISPNLDPNSIPDPNPVLDQLLPDPSLNPDPVSIRDSPNFRISQHTRGFD